MMSRGIFGFINILLWFFIIALVSKSYSMPPLNPGPEPDRPDWMNAQFSRSLDRDDADIEGEWNCLAILIDFEDYPWDNQEDTLFINEGNPYTQEHFEAMLYSEGEFSHPGSQNAYTGSMRDYYSEVSRGLFTVTGIATTWYRAPEAFSYYCNADGRFGTDDDYGWGDYPQNAQGLVEQAILAADIDVDFSLFDNDDDGEVDALFIVHAGPGAELFGRNETGANYIWSHKGVLERGGHTLDDVRLWEYTISPESGAIGVFCHEFGHLLGLPDLYDIDYSTQGIGEWGLMGKGSWGHRPGDVPESSPAHMCGWSKAMLGWVEVVDILTPVRDLEIPPIQSSGIIYRVFPNGLPQGHEYFFIENRRWIGFDAGLLIRQVIHGLPAPEGLLITHIDMTRRGEMNQDNANEERRLVDVEEASILQLDEDTYVEQLDIRHNNDWLNLYNGNRGDNGDLWPGFSECSEDSTNWIGRRNNDCFDSNSIPSTVLNTGEPSNVRISDIRFYHNYSICCNVQPDCRTANPCIAGWNINDDDEGNGNRFIEPGEIIDLNVTLKNIGDEPMEQVHTVITTDMDRIEILNDTSSYSNLESGHSETGLTPFRFRLGANRDDIRPVEFNLTVNCWGGRWQIPLEIGLQKHILNPVMSADLWSWDNLGVESPSIILENDTLKCWYIGISEGRPYATRYVGYGWSVDGGVTWRRLEEPIIAPGLDGLFLTDVAVTRIEDGYLMILVTMGSIFNGYYEGRLLQALSEDGIEWDVDMRPIISHNEGWFFMSLGFSQVSLYRLDDQDEITLAFAAVNQEFRGNGIATATTRDLNHWTVQDNPLIRSTYNRNQFDGGAIFSPEISFIDGEFIMLYGGIDERGIYDEIFEHTTRFGLQTSRDGVNFNRCDGPGTGGCLIEPDEQVDWREEVIFGGRLFEWKGQYRILYCAIDTTTCRLAFGLALGLPTMVSEWVKPRSETDHLISATPILHNIYPNPFNSSTIISYTIPAGSVVSLKLFDLTGREVKSLVQGYIAAGNHSVMMSGENLASGVYLVRMKAGDREHVKKVLLVR